MEAENLHSKSGEGRTYDGEMDVFSSVSLKDRKQSEDLYSLLGIQSVVRW